MFVPKKKKHKPTLEALGIFNREEESIRAMVQSTGTMHNPYTPQSVNK